MFLVTLLYLVSIFLEDIFAIFGQFSGFSAEIALRHSTFRRNSGKIPKIIKMLSTHEKSPTSPGAPPPSLTRSGVWRAPVELGHGSTAGFFS